MTRNKKSSTKKVKSNKIFFETKKILLVLTSVTVGGLIVVGFNKMNQTKLEKNDHKQPLTIKNLSYCNGEKLDIVVPNNGKNEEKPPLLIYIHGGGWMYGSKVGGAAPYFYKLTKNNIAVASINYRLSGVAKFPEPVKDVVCAVKYLKAKSGLLGFDSDKVFLAGQSSGANLALMAGLASDEKIFEQNKYSDISSKVQGIIALDAHYDLNFKDLSSDTKVNIMQYLSSEKDMFSASPVNYLKSTSPSVLIFHGVNDKRIPVASARQFEQKAAASGAKVSLIEVKNADHNLNSLFKRDSPSANERLEIIKSFIAQNMKE